MIEKWPHPKYIKYLGKWSVMLFIYTVYLVAEMFSLAIRKTIEIYKVLVMGYEFEIGSHLI